MEIRHLRYFYTIAQEGSISKAAQILMITQPTLSRQLKELEDHLGTTLFDREKNRLRLTSDGFLLKERAAEILQLEENLLQVFEDKRQEELSGMLTIGCVEGDNSDTLALFLEEFIQEHPQVQFTLFTGMSDDIMDRLEKGLLDMAILLDPINLEHCESLVLPRKENWGFLMAKDHAFAQQHHLTPQDVAQLHVICSHRLIVQELLQNWGHFTPNQLHLVGHFNLIFNVLPLVEHHIGEAFAIEGAVTTRKSEELVFVPLDPPLQTNCRLVWKKRRQTRVVQQFIAKFTHAFG